MNLASSVLFASIIAAFLFTTYRLLKHFFNILKNDGSEPACSCCSGKCSHCNRCAKSAEVCKQ